MSFLDELQKGTNRTFTENGAVTNASSLDYNLDFFSLAGAMRNNKTDAVKLFEKAFYANKQTAIRTLFYLRDVRGGQGERDIFKACFRKLIEIDSNLANKLLHFVPEYGRWDDLLDMYGDKTSHTIIEIIKTQIACDYVGAKTGGSISLLAKWMPTQKSSNAKTRKLASDLRIGMGLDVTRYRKRIANLRKYLILLEQQMSSKEWSAINYSNIPSQAHRKHVAAFKRNDGQRYSEFLAKAQKGEVKVNTGTLYTYEVFDLIQKGQEDAANAMWQNLPDYTNGSDALVVADVSGSMYGRPMDVSVSLALYYAEHNKGIFNNKFMTFSQTPQLIDIVGDTLSQKLSMIEDSEWGMNTDLEAVFRVILNSAIISGANGDDMPKVIYIISDMQFDRCTSNPSDSIFDNAARQFQAQGLKLPHVVFWNVNARDIQSPATKFDNRVTLISGLSQSTFKYAVEGKTPIELMNEVINGDRYNNITI